MAIRPGKQPLHNCRVLVVEDTPYVCMVIKSLLRKIDIEKVEIAEDGIEGLEKASTFRPDMIVLDINMPRMNGLEMLQKLREDPEQADTPVIVQTAVDTKQARNEMFQAGATDFISKPVNSLEFLSRVRVHLENRMLVRTLDSQLRRIEAELTLAKRMQAALLPSEDAIKAAEDRCGLQIRHHFETSSELGGDYWRVHPIAEGKLAVFISDFAGHGASAALNTVRLHTLIEKMTPEEMDDPARCVDSLNRHLVEALPRGHFATFLFGLLDTNTHQFTYASAAAPDPLIGKVGEGVHRVCDGAGLPIGITKSAFYETHTVDFPAGSFLFLYSDALFEASDPQEGISQKEAFLTEFKEVVQKAPSEGVLPHLIELYFSRTPSPPPDDLTAVWIEHPSR